MMLIGKVLFQCDPNIIKSSVLQKKFRLKEGQEICNMAKSNPKQFWKTVKKKLNSKKIQSDKLTANDLFEHFKFIYGEEPGDVN